MAEGKHANYCTQFSFKNQVDDFYVLFLRKQTIKMDIYMSRDSAAVHLGRCEVALQDLIESEPKASDGHIVSETQVINGYATIFPISGSSEVNLSRNASLGQIKYKMRLRRPIAETVKFFSQRAELNNMNKAVQYKASTLRAPKRLVTIQVHEAS